MTNKNYKHLRNKMIQTQLKERGINDESIIEAFRVVPRHLFVPDSYKKQAYSDRPLPIGDNQTISQPYIVALMTQLLQLTGEDEVLEIGTGSGFQTAILAELASEVFTIERKSDLQERAKYIHRSLEIDNVAYFVGDGTVGWPEHSPYSKILGTGGVPDVPDSLLDQLADSGRMVIPVGDRRQQRLYTVVKKTQEVSYKKGVYCSFVPLVGEYGW